MLAAASYRRGLLATILGSESLLNEALVFGELATDTGLISKASYLRHVEDCDAPRLAATTRRFSKLLGLNQLQITLDQGC